MEPQKLEGKVVKILTDGATYPTLTDVRLRVVEALSRNQNAIAINDPDMFIKSVAKIADFVLGEKSQPVSGVQTRRKKPPP